MNKCCRIIWSKIKNAWIVVSEISKSHGKGPSTGGVVHQVSDIDSASAANRAFKLTTLAVMLSVTSMPVLPAHCRA
ncbi:ESPR domain-containing protein [Aquirhabdus sp.]|uniref:ESPR domain-containing protein n=1 Tax=Aquirhabdus sp. TaxID=2824160 RepID=UPI00396C98FD